MTWIEILVVLTLSVFGLFAVLGTYWLIGLIGRRWVVYSLRRKGRIIEWSAALEKVKRAEGYFLLTKSKRQRDLFYSDGEMAPHHPALMRIYQTQASLVQAHPEIKTTSDLERFQVGGRFRELDLNALVV